MNISILLNDPVFYITIISVIFFSSLAILGLRRTKPRELSDREKLGITLILLGETIGIAMVLLFSWLTFKESIVWAFQNHNNLSTTTGRVIESSTEWRGSLSHNAFGLHFQIWYEYKVNETLYKSDQITYGYTGSSDESFAESYTKKYPVGKSVTVYYDPLDPKLSVLEPDVIEYGGLLSLINITTLCLFTIPATLLRFVRVSA